MRPFRLACLAFLGASLPGSTFGLLWPSIRLSFHQPIGALGILLVIGVTAEAVSSAAAGRIMSRAGGGPLIALATGALALALALEVVAPSMWVFACGTVVFGIGFGATNSAVNVHAAASFSAREINWMHASYGLGATLGPLLVTGLLSAHLSWRSAYAIMAAVEVALAVVFAVTRRAWQDGRPPAPSVQQTGDVAQPPGGAAQPSGGATQPSGGAAQPSGGPGQGSRRHAVVLGGLAFAAIESGIESAAGLWGYVFLTAGRGLSPQVAGVCVSAYWATMFAGRMIFGSVAGRVGARRVLAAAVAGVAVGAAVMAVPGIGWLSAVGLVILGLAAAPIFPLLTLTTAERLGAASEDGTTRTVGLQVAASAAGSAALPGGVGLAVGSLGAGILAPLLLALGLAMFGMYRLVSGR